MVLGLPDKGITIADLVGVLTGLDQRVAALEAWQVDHTAQVARRQAEVNRLKSNNQRDAWLKTLKKGHRS